MTEQEIAKKKAGFNRVLTKEFAQGDWKWRGGSFFNAVGFGGTYGAPRVIVEFNCKLMTIIAAVFPEPGYGLDDSKAIFTGNNAIQDCIDWAVQKLIEIHLMLLKRTAPYINGYEQYQKAMRGE